MSKMYQTAQNRAYPPPPPPQQLFNITETRIVGASVAQWSERSPFISEVAGPIVSENAPNVTRTQCSIHAKRVTQHSAESRGFSLGAPVSSHREVDRVG